jgi:hypothetical protein
MMIGKKGEEKKDLLTAGVWRHYLLKGEFEDRRNRCEGYPVSAGVYRLL